MPKLAIQNSNVFFNNLSLLILKLSLDFSRALLVPMLWERQVSLLCLRGQAWKFMGSLWPQKRLEWSLTGCVQPWRVHGEGEREQSVTGSMLSWRSHGGESKQSITDCDNHEEAMKGEKVEHHRLQSWRSNGGWESGILSNCVVKERPWRMGE